MYIKILPIPEEPKNRKTNGWSSSYQPFSFLLIAENTQNIVTKWETKSSHYLLFNLKGECNPKSIFVLVKKYRQQNLKIFLNPTIKSFRILHYILPN